MGRLVVSLSLLTIAIGTRAPAAGSPLTWPALTLSYTVEGHFHGLSEPTSMQTWHLTYRDQHHWSKEIVADTGQPGSVGEVHRFEGSTLSTYSAVIDAATSSNAPNVAVDWWLIPGREVKLMDEGYTQEVDAQHSLVRYTMTAAWPCDRSIPGNLGLTQPSSCATDDAFEVTESVLYRTDVIPILPIQVTTTFNGVVTSTITVSEVQLSAH